MIDGISKELLNYGVAVAILVPILAFFLWAGRTIVLSLMKHIDDFFREVLAQQKEVTGAIKELAASYSSIRENCRACRVDSIASLRDAEERITKRVTDVAWAVHDKTFDEIKTGFASLERVFERSLTGAAESIRESNTELAMNAENDRLRRENAELSKPHVVGAVPR